MMITPRWTTNLIIRSEMFGDVLGLGGEWIPQTEDQIKQGKQSKK